MKTYSIGQVVRIKGTWKDINGNNIDPQTVAFNVLLPDGTTVTKTWQTDSEVKRDSLGVFYMDYAITQNGVHWWSTTSTGNGAGYEEMAFHVRKTKTAAQ